MCPFYWLNVCVPLKFICWSPVSDVAIWGDGASKEIIKVKVVKVNILSVRPWSDGIGVFVRDISELSLSLCARTKERPCKETIRWLSANQRESSYWKPNWPEPSSWACNFQNCEKMHLCFLNHPSMVFCYGGLSRLILPPLNCVSFKQWLACSWRWLCCPWLPGTFGSI